MEIGKINDLNVNNSIDSSKSKASDDEFEKRLKSAMENKDDKELKKVCKNFESIILNMMYKQMKATVPKAELLPEDVGKDIFDSMLDDKLMEEAANGTGAGLADVLYKQLRKQVRSSDSASASSKGEENIAGEK
ncbi:MAG: rod-binding protein [Clostridia bacterium]|nr:rod-binding protein [Clostridia bacterium]